MTPDQTSSIMKLAYAPWPTHTLTPSTIEAAHLVLEPFEYDEVRAALALALEHCEFPPTPRDIAEQVKSARRQRAQLAYAQMKRKEGTTFPPEVVEELFGKLYKMMDLYSGARGDEQKIRCADDYRQHLKDYYLQILRELRG